MPAHRPSSNPLRALLTALQALTHTGLALERMRGLETLSACLPGSAYQGVGICCET
jgi:hypothetical protein